MVQPHLMLPSFLHWRPHDDQGVVWQLHIRTGHRPRPSTPAAAHSAWHLIQSGYEFSKLSGRTAKQTLHCFVEQTTLTQQ